MDATTAAANIRKQVSRRRARILPALVLAAALAPAGPWTAFAGAPRPARPRTAARPALGLLDGAEDAKARLLELLDDESLEEVLAPEGRPLRGRLGEAITQLERANPTPEPVYSELLDGTWQAKYTGAYAPGLLASPTRELALFLYGGGFSPSNALASLAAGFWGPALGFRLGTRRVQIRDGQAVEASAEVEAAGRKETLRYTAELMPLSAARMSEEVLSLDLPGPVGKQEAPFELRRNMLVTYLDEDVMIVRDESGVPEVLVKELVEVVPAQPAVEVDANATTTGANTTGAAAAAAASLAAGNSTEA